MRLIVQRVQRAAGRVGGEGAAEIGPGLAILVGVRTTDTPAEAQALAEKVAHLRIFSDEAGKLNRSVLEVGGAVLSVPQFTLYADASKGRRPSFVDAAGGAPAASISEGFNRALQAPGGPPAGAGGEYARRPAGPLFRGREPLPSGPSRCRLHARRRGSGRLRGGPARPIAERSYPHGRRGPAAAAGPRGRRRRSRR